MRRATPLLTAGLLVVACSSPRVAATTTTSAPAPVTTVTAAAPVTTEPIEAFPLPPHERDDLAAIFDPMVGGLGYRVTRAALISRQTYVVTPDGDHLAIYVAPLEDIPPDRFAADLPGLLDVFLPEIFDRWPELSSFDICQEPFGSTAETPPSQTIVDLTREAAASVEWAGIDLATLIDAGGRVDGLVVWARDPVRESMTWQEAASK